MDRLRKPVMIACAGRSGSTFFYRALARHEDFGWLSTYNQKCPGVPAVSALSRLYGSSALTRIRNSYYFPKPFSPYRFWQRFLPDIARHERPLTAEDVPDEVIEPLRQTLSKILRYQGKSRFLMKVTGWARMGYFNRILPDAQFIYLRRRPISIVSSWIKAGWLNVTGELGSNEWEWGDVPASYQDAYDDLGGGPLLSACVKTQLDIDDLRRNADEFDDRCYRLDYEDLIRDPDHYFREVADFCEIPWTDHFASVVESTKTFNYVDKWKKQIDPAHGETIEEFFQRVDPQHTTQTA